MKYKTLSYMIGKDSLVHIGLKKPVIIPNSQISQGNGYNTFIITVENHSGTHIDAPRHFISGAREIMDYSADEFISSQPVIIDIAKGERELIGISDLVSRDLKGVDCILFKTGFGKYRQTHKNKYLTLNPGISWELIEYIRENFPNIRCLGLDSVSISPYRDSETAIKSHLMAFKEEKSMGEPLLLIEDLNLNEVSSDDQLKTLIVCPWQIKGIDSAPCSVIAEIE